MVSERVREYELVMIIRPEATEEEVLANLEKVSKFITDRGGEVSETKNWGLRQFAYPIEKRREGTYISAKFNLDAQGALEMGKTLTASEEILRHLVTKVE
ncbi:MAG: 30S ribosomal protein S6 [Chloroflexi bacterium]|nr:30S ribosomal protein S6 [Chloroflexota bacterium]